MVEPLPLVPATWMTGGTRLSGWPRRSSTRRMRSSDRSMRLGCSASSRARIESTGVIGVRRYSAAAAVGGKASAGLGLGHLTGGRLAQHAAKPRQRRLELMAVHHEVDEAMLFQIFRALEAFGQLLADGLLDDARARKSDQRAGLRDMHVAEHGVGGGHAAGGRIGQHHDVGLLRLAQHFDPDRGARQLHQRQDAFMHARAAGGREHDEGRALLRGGFQALDDRLARRHAERAAHEVEILHPDDDRQAIELAEAELDGIVHAGLGAGILQPVRVAPLVAELERVDRHVGHADIEPDLAVEHGLQARGRAHAHVIVRRGDDELVRLDVLVEHKLPGLRALDPHVLRRLALEQRANLRPDHAGKPVHGTDVIPNGGQI